MKIPWKLLILMAVLVTASITAFDFLVAMDADPNLAQYDIVEISENLGVEVLQHMADSNDKIYVRTNQIGQIRITNE